MKLHNGSEALIRSSVSSNTETGLGFSNDPQHVELRFGSESVFLAAKVGTYPLAERPNWPL